MHLLHAWWRGPFEDLLPQEKSYFPRTSPEGTLVFLGFIIFYIKMWVFVKFSMLYLSFLHRFESKKAELFFDVKKI